MEMVIALVSLALIGAALLCLSIIALAVAIGHLCRWLAKTATAHNIWTGRGHLTRAGR